MIITPSIVFNLYFLPVIRYHYRLRYCVMLQAVFPELWTVIFCLLYVTEFIYLTEVLRIIVRKLTTVDPRKRTTHFQNINLHYTPLTFISRKLKFEPKVHFWPECILSGKNPQNNESCHDLIYYNSGEFGNVVVVVAGGDGGCRSGDGRGRSRFIGVYNTHMYLYLYHIYANPTGRAV